ncbi:hypothetical protein ACLOJK_020044 [Asimina triloba]
MTRKTLTAVGARNVVTGEDAVERERERQGETTTEPGNGEDDGGDADGGQGREWGDRRRRCGERERDRGKRRQSSGMEKTTGETLTVVEVGNGETGEDVVESVREIKGNGDGAREWRRRRGRCCRQSQAHYGARHIVRTLGRTETMIDDILQIFSTLDGHFSYDKLFDNDPLNLN